MEAQVTRRGMRIVARRGNTLSHFTAYKIYEVIAGAGDENLSHVAAKFGMTRLSERAMNVRDDLGNIRYVTLDFFREFKLESGVLYND